LEEESDLDTRECRENRDKTSNNMRDETESQVNAHKQKYKMELENLEGSESILDQIYYHRSGINNDK